MEYKILDLHLFHYEEDNGKRYKSKKKRVILDDLINFLCIDLACGKCKKYLSGVRCPCILEIEKCPKFKKEKALADKYFNDVFYGEGVGTPILKRSAK